MREARAPARQQIFFVALKVLSNDKSCVPEMLRRMPGVNDWLRQFLLLLLCHCPCWLRQT